jgi:hypothetical protein
LYASCSQANPEVLYGFLNLSYYSPSDERLSFFVLPQDADGFEDLGDLYLYNDAAGLSWHLTPADWVQYQDGDNIWIGSRSLAMPDEAPLPRGAYRAVLVDKGGAEGERTFSLDAPETPRHPFPGFTVDRGTGSYSISSGYPSNRLICYDGEG